uniref:Synaptotagmin-like protein 4 n=1 Tax=Lates calcarifer TaxID=8187 RepID=A0A4W6EC72_LATCA
MPQSPDMINLGFLSDSERELILEVLRRDEELRQAEEQRVCWMSKRKGAKRGSGRYSQRSCGRCLEPLSRLSVFSSQCTTCNHYVCSKCRTVLPNGSWVCSVCAKESDLKKMTGDWFYDQRVNRFSTMPGHNLVRVSLKKKSPLKKRETMGEVLLRSTEINSDLPAPVPRPRQKIQTDNKGFVLILHISFRSSRKEDEEEEEDIDSLVSFHKRTMASSSSSLHSKSTMGSLMSIYSEAGDFDSVEVSGDIVFSLNYDEHTQSLQVFIKECQGLAFGDASRQLTNPYVKCYLLPDKSRQSKRKTTIKRNTINPVYKETLKYSISRSQLLTRSILISVWHHGRLSRNAFLGEVEIALDCRDLDTAYEDRMLALTDILLSNSFAQYKGELVISLKYITPKNVTTEKIKGKKAVTEEGGELHVLIKEAKNLMAMKPGGMSDSFVKGYLFPTKAKNTKRKTPVMKKNLNPHYDHTFVFKELSLEQLRGMCLELTVWDREAMLSNEFLGGIRLSSGKGTVKIGKEEVEKDSVGEEVSLWEKMMQYPDSWAEGTLPLRSTMGKAKAK